MKLRIARKMDPGSWQRLERAARDKRAWRAVYTDDQLRRAERRLERSWRTACPPAADGSRAVSPDFFAANRVQSRRIRQAALRRHRARAMHGAGA